MTNANVEKRKTKRKRKKHQKTYTEVNNYKKNEIGLSIGE